MHYHCLKVPVSSWLESVKLFTVMSQVAGHQCWAGEGPFLLPPPAALPAWAGFRGQPPAWPGPTPSVLTLLLQWRQVVENWGMGGWG